MSAAGINNIIKSRDNPETAYLAPTFFISLGFTFSITK